MPSSHRGRCDVWRSCRAVAGVGVVRGDDPVPLAGALDDLWEDLPARRFVLGQESLDTILLGSPVWNVQAPMIMDTFIESVDLTGKTLHPFVTYAVSAMGSVRDDYADKLPRTTVTQGLALRGETIRDARPDIQRWLRSIGLT